jgi:hypothetical protein
MRQHRAGQRREVLRTANTPHRRRAQELDQLVGRVRDLANDEHPHVPAVPPQGGHAAGTWTRSSGPDRHTTTVSCERCTTGSVTELPCTRPASTSHDRSSFASRSPTTDAVPAQTERACSLDSGPGTSHSQGPTDRPCSSTGTARPSLRRIAAISDTTPGSTPSP